MRRLRFKQAGVRHLWWMWVAISVVVALWGGAPGARAFPTTDRLIPRKGGPTIVRGGFKMARDLTLHFDHQLGAVEAQRRVADRLEKLRVQFADKVGSSTVIWSGNEAQVQVSALGQNASGHVSVGDADVTILVHLPLLLSPLGGNIAAFLTKTANETLQP